MSLSTYNFFDCSPSDGCKLAKFKNAFYVGTISEGIFSDILLLSFDSNILIFLGPKLNDLSV